MAQAYQNAHRLLGHVWSLMNRDEYINAWAVQNDAQAPKIIVSGTDYESWNQTMVLSPTLSCTVLAPYVVYRYVPPNATHVHVRIHGVFNGTNAASVHCMCASDPPGTGFAAVNRVSATTGTPSSSIQFVNFALLPVVNPGGYNWFYLGFSWETRALDETVVIKEWTGSAVYETP